MIDLNKARQRLEELQTTKRDYSKLTYSLKQGDNKVRFIRPPEITGDDLPFLYGQLYYKLRKSWTLSPTAWGDDDPVLQELNLLRNTGKEQDAAFVKKMYPSNRVFGLVVVRGQEDKGAVWMDFPPKVEKELIKYILNEEYGDITDIKTGTDFTITKTKGSSWPEYSVIPTLRSANPLMPTPAESEAILKDTPKFEQAYHRYTREQMLKFWAFIS